jgi:hypothetical protein
MRRFLAYKEKYGTGYVPFQNTKRGKEIMQIISPEFVYWANNCRIAIQEIRDGSPVPHKGITTRKLNILTNAGFETTSSPGDARGKAGGGKGRKRPRFSDLEPLIREYARHNSENRPPAYGHVVNLNNQEIDLGSIIARNVSKINRDAGLRDKEEYVNLFKELQWID